MDFTPDPDADPASLTYTFGGVGAVAELPTHTLLRTWTRDCFGGLVRRPGDLASQLNPGHLNPQTGPFWINESQPGDTVAVHFVRIEPREAWGVSTTVPLFGALTATPATAMLHPPLPERTWFYELDRIARVVRYAALDTDFTAALPLDPMHGTVGVAPPLGEVRSTLTPGSWGGNLDTPEMRAGVTCYLGVNVAGALLSVGDGHARQGEGETCGVAVECAMDTQLIVGHLGDYYTPTPRLESDQYLMSSGSARPLEDAFRIAHRDLVRWVSELTGMSELDSYQLVSQTALTPIANVVDTNYTVVAKIPKSVLGNAAGGAMGGLHGQLRALSAGY
jgi:acetamidase/formamidase